MGAGLEPTIQKGGVAPSDQFRKDVETFGGGWSQAEKRHAKYIIDELRFGLMARGGE